MRLGRTPPVPETRFASAAREWTSPPRRDNRCSWHAMWKGCGDTRSLERPEEPMPRKMQHAYVDGFVTARRLLGRVC